MRTRTTAATGLSREKYITGATEKYDERGAREILQLRRQDWGFSISTRRMTTELEDGKTQQKEWYRRSWIDEDLENVGVLLVDCKHQPLSF
jgi:hypothetical protein